jgi:hypothetical protein
MALGDRMTTFEESERESEYGYVRKVCLSASPLFLSLSLSLSPAPAGSRDPVAWISDA